MRNERVCVFAEGDISMSAKNWWQLDKKPAF
jgi:hypothetical protein